jgi:hypothetical protein
MVHPGLTTDPVNMQGHLGTISHVRYEDWTAYVKFSNQMIGLYDVSALLMLVPSEIVSDMLRTYVQETDMGTSDVLDILEMYLLHTSGNAKNQQEALDWAMTHATISQAIVFTVEDWMQFQLDRLDMQQQPGR